MRREKSEAVGTVFEMNVEGKRGERKSRKKGLDAIDSDMRIVGVCVDDVRDDRIIWRFRT